MSYHIDEGCAGLADECDLSADVFTDDRRCPADFSHCGQRRDRSVNGNAQLDGIELVEKRLKRRFEAANGNCCLGRTFLPQQVDQHCCAPAVAIVDVRRVDHDALLRCLLERPLRLTPNTGD